MLLSLEEQISTKILATTLAIRDEVVHLTLIYIERRLDPLDDIIIFLLTNLGASLRVQVYMCSKVLTLMCAERCNLIGIHGKKQHTGQWLCSSKL